MNIQDEVVYRVNELKKLLDRFMAQVEKSIAIYQKDPDQLNNEEIAKLALRIWELRHFSEELLTKPINETLRYNAKIILRVIDQPIFQELGKTTSLISAADQSKRENRAEKLKTLIHEMIINGEAKEILFDDLRTLGRELSA
jgi:hypothetical protein